MIVFHGGCEIGQGIHTKVVLAVADSLGIDSSMVKVGDTNTDVSVMTGITGGSITSEVNAQAARLACEKLKQRVGYIKMELWKETNKVKTFFI